MPISCNKKPLLADTIIVPPKVAFVPRQSGGKNKRK